MPKPTDISVLAELERYQLKYEFAGSDEVRVQCPFHGDAKPSCNVSLSKRVFCCQAAECGKSGDLVTLLAKVVGRSRAVVLEELGQRYDLDDVKTVEPEVVEQWHQEVWRAGPLLEELRKRAVSDDELRLRKIGYDASTKRVTIPIPNARGDWVNVRKYLPGAPGADKMRNMRGRGSARWYPHDQLSYQSVLLTGGEMKSIVAATRLNPHGVGALWITHGERAIPTNLLKELVGKSVCLGFDVDAGGRACTEQVGRELQGVASEVLEVVYPLDIDQYPKGDLNDFVAAGGDLWALYQQAEPWADRARASLDDSEPSKISLASASSAQHAGRRVSVVAVPTAADTAPYLVPKDVTVKCDRSQPFCSVCPVFPTRDGKFSVHPESQAVLEVVHNPKRAVRDALVGAFGIPRACRVCEFEADSYFNAEDVRLSSQIEITDRAAVQKMQPAVCIGTGLALNEPYEMTGRMWPHPETQQSTLVISSYGRTRDALGSYAPTTGQLEVLEAFKPREWSVEGVQEKLDHLYGDLSLAVTRIYGRQDVHLVLDLMYHSPLFIRHDGDVVKGWVEVLIVGDSAQGKSEVARRLMQHYGLGERIEMKNSTVAGLLGGLKQHAGNRWMVEWGIIVRNDRGALIMDEVKGTSVETIGKMTDARSSGVVELNKIEKTRAHARTRLAWMSNVRGEGRRVASYGYGIEAARELIGNLEDLRRFDLVLVISDDEVDPAVINAGHAAKNGQVCRYPPDLCRALILWAWTRTAEQCEFEKPVGKMCLAEASRLSELFVDSLPVVDRGSARHKVARLAAALAARTFSASDDRQSLVVRECHVRYAGAMLERLYTKPACGYRAYSEAARSIEALQDPDTLVKALSAMPFPYEFIESALRADRIEAQDLQDWCGWGREETARFVSLLVRKHALHREGRAYKKTAAFADLLRRVQGERSMPDRPDHIPEAEF